MRSWLAVGLQLPRGFEAGLGGWAVGCCQQGFSSGSLKDDEGRAEGFVWWLSHRGWQALPSWDGLPSWKPRHPPLGGASKDQRGVLGGLNLQWFFFLKPFAPQDNRHVCHQGKSNTLSRTGTSPTVCAESFRNENRNCFCITAADGPPLAPPCVCWVSCSQRRVETASQNPQPWVCITQATQQSLCFLAEWLSYVPRRQITDWRFTSWLAMKF